MMKALIWVFLTVSTDAFVIPGRYPLLPVIAQQHDHHLAPLQMSGFGGAASSKGKTSKNKKATKLKPRKQWDRFISDDMKSSDSIRVAVCVVSNTPANVSKKWYPVGEVKSKDNAHTEAAVVRHRMLISEHARRIFPAEILPNDKLDWGYCCSTKTTEEDDDEEFEWIIAGKVDTMPSDIDRLIGFRGYPDRTGFYASLKGSSDIGGTNAYQSDDASMKVKGVVGHSQFH